MAAEGADLAKDWAAAQAEVARLSAENGHLKTQIQLLREGMDALLRRIYGKKADRIDPKLAPWLFPEAGAAAAPAEPEDEGEEPPPSHPKRRALRARRRPRLPDNLEIREERLPDPPEVEREPDAWRKIGEEWTDRLGFEPAKYYRLRQIRSKWASEANPYTPPVIAALPDRVGGAGSIATPELLAHILTGKFCDHLPLYRQERIFRARHGVPLPRQTMASWVRECAFWLDPIVRIMLADMIESGYVQADETCIKCLDRNHAAGIVQGWLWPMSAPQGDVVFAWSRGRAAKDFAPRLPDGWSGILQCDGHKAYGKLAREARGRIVLVGCWAHARRKFVEAAALDPRFVAWVMRQMGILYEGERELRQARAGPRLRDAERKAQHLPRVRRMLREIRRRRGDFLPQSKMGKAIDYLLEQLPTLLAALMQGWTEIDNNLIENAIRPSALGKKNWLFIGSPAAGPRAATIYSLTESCRRRGIEPYDYLVDILTRLPTMKPADIAELTPARWQAARRGKTLRHIHSPRQGAAIREALPRLRQEIAAELAMGA